MEDNIFYKHLISKIDKLIKILDVLSLEELKNEDLVFCTIFTMIHKYCEKINEYKVKDITTDIEEAVGNLSAGNIFQITKLLVNHKTVQNYGR